MNSQSGGSIDGRYVADLVCDLGHQWRTVVVDIADKYGDADNAPETHAARDPKSPGRCPRCPTCGASGALA